MAISSSFFFLEHEVAEGGLGTRLVLGAKLDLADDAQGSAKASGDAGNVEQHALPDHDRYLAAKEAARDKKRTNKMGMPETRGHWVITGAGGLSDRTPRRHGESRRAHGSNGNLV